MKKVFMLLCLIFLSFNLYSAELNCRILKNQDVVSDGDVVTLVNQQASIDSLEDVSAYITEKAGSLFMIEAYFVEHDLRVYAEGKLQSAEDKLALSTWGRSSMFDIECRLK